MLRLHLVLLSVPVLTLVLTLVLSLSGCAPESKVMRPEVPSSPVDEFASSFRARNAEIRGDLIAELTKREIPFRLNEDGSIGYRQVDGKDIDAVYYWVVGLYAARN